MPPGSKEEQTETEAAEDCVEGCPILVAKNPDGKSKSELCLWFAVGVFAAVLLFQCSITIAFLIAIVLLMVDVEVFGFLYIIGAKLNSLSLVNLGIVIGMASEFTYLARCFLAVDGARNERTGRALELTLEPLLHGLATQIAAIFPLIFLKYHAFRVYYFGMFTIMGVLGFLNGFVLLPVLLSVLGPPPLPQARMHAPESLPAAAPSLPPHDNPTYTEVAESQ